MFYTIYVTINKKNGRFYIGKHQTENPNDEYLGSGTILELAIIKYGKDSFIKLTNESYATEAEMNKREQHLVDAVFLDEWEGICYNIAEGGTGGNLKNSPCLLPKTHPRFMECNEKRYNSSPQYLPNNHPRKIKWYKKTYDKLALNLEKDDPKFIHHIQKMKDNHPQYLPHDDPRWIQHNNHIRETNPWCKPKESEQYQNVFENQQASLPQKKDINHPDKIEWMKINSPIASAKGKKKKDNIWIKNILLTQIKHIKKEELQNYLDMGWVKGRYLNRVVWITNKYSYEHLRIEESNLQSYLNHDWIRGRKINNHMDKST
jgi:hypothetical protein